MERFGGGNKPLVVVDYAHTPDALKHVLQALRPHCKGSLWCVFGCGGDRDRGKRSIMGDMAEQYADKVVLTDDNPRNENPDQIINEIVSGIRNTDDIHIERDRARAIGYAIGQASSDDIVLIAGKGHEEYQLVKDRRIPFSDRKLVSQLLQEVAE
jgi:UDP-N-acetylmuramoyl-L-alanyl-D-glutamate--2,6-diaminopimelate ligase